MYVADRFFPAGSSFDTEEERRLLYVALTRAEELLEVVGQGDSFLFRELDEDGGTAVDRVTACALNFKVPPAEQKRSVVPPSSKKDQLLADLEDEDDDDDGYVPITQTNLFD